MRKYKATAELEAFLASKAGPHYVCDNSNCYIDTLAGLQSFRALHGDSFENTAIPVFPCGPDSPFSIQGDAAYQAYHDRLHATGGYQFDIAGELRLALKHWSDAKEAGLRDEDAAVLFHFVASRVLYHYYHNGSDPPCRATFVRACLDCCGSQPVVCTHSARGDYEDQIARYFR